MSVTAPPAPPGPPGGDRPFRWQSISATWSCGQDHGTPGALDESARRLTHEEYAVARLLVGEGHDVRSLAESRQGRTPDLEACGRPVEVKSWPRSDERIRVPGPQSVYNKLCQAVGQSDTVVLYAQGSGLTPASARRGVAMFASDRRRAELSTVRVVGDGFDLAWARGPGLHRPPRAPSRDRGLGL